MDSFDYFLIALGIILIVIGLFLFVAGKTDSKIANQVEGFGIKINVSNPSVLLIVMGVGLVLIPRLLPSDASTASQPEATNNPHQNQVTTNNPVNIQQQEPESVVSIQPEQTETLSQQPIQRKFFPEGNWVLAQYEENGIDLSYMIAGNATFSKRSHDKQSWQFQMQSVDMWGNPLFYNYQGNITATSSGYLIETETSNDPAFIRQAPVNLVMKMDPSGLLHIEYVFNGSQIIMHFAR